MSLILGTIPYKYIFYESNSHVCLGCHKLFINESIHRLLFWSKQFELYNQLNEAFMIAYFTNGIDLSKRDNILQIVTEVGLNVSEAEKILSTDASS